MVASSDRVLTVVSDAVSFRAALRTVEVEVLSGESAALVAEELARVEKACAAVRAMAAARAADCGAHRSAGYADPDEWMARMTGESRAKARSDLATGSRLADCPKTREAAADGDLSLGQAEEITKTEREKPGSEDSLIAKAKRSSRQELADDCRKRRQEGVDREALAAKQRARRSFRSWIDGDGMHCALLKLAPVDGVALLARIQTEADRLHREARKAGSVEPWEAHAADAVASILAAGLGFAVPGMGGAPGAAPAASGGAGEGSAGGGEDEAGGSSTGACADEAVDGSDGGGDEMAPAVSFDDDAGAALASGADPPADGSAAGGGADSPPSEARPGGGSVPPVVRPRAPRRADVVFVVDLRTFRTGMHPDSICHIVGGGPVPPSVVREMAKDAFLKVVFHDGVKIHTVTHLGRYQRAELRTALELGGPPDFDGVVCSVCGNRFKLQWDHVKPIAAGGVTSFANEDAKCWRCHDEKSRREREAGLYRRRDPVDCGGGEGPDGGGGEGPDPPPHPPPDPPPDTG